MTFTVILSCRPFFSFESHGVEKNRRSTVYCPPPVLCSVLWLWENCICGCLAFWRFLPQRLLEEAMRAHHHLQQFCHQCLWFELIVLAQYGCNLSLSSHLEVTQLCQISPNHGDRVFDVKTLWMVLEWSSLAGIMHFWNSASQISCQKIIEESVWVVKMVQQPLRTEL